MAGEPSVALLRYQPSPVGLGEGRRLEELAWTLQHHPYISLAHRQGLQDPSEDRQGLATLFPLSSLATTMATTVLVSTLG